MKLHHVSVIPLIPEAPTLKAAPRNGVERQFTRAVLRFMSSPETRLCAATAPMCESRRHAPRRRAALLRPPLPPVLGSISQRAPPLASRARA
ncbi:unnamed protein product [Closterium sp. Yama58-4]|nr:unnamed protein product [Closterium sp. Yama58-4]